jgi:hypothetical protein
MNRTLAIALLLLTPGAAQLVPPRSETLVGSIIKYDASMSSHSAQADLIVKVQSKGTTKYVRLRYAPDGFGFDAPIAKPEQLLPKEMFSNGALSWTFRFHAPHNRDEEGACLRPGKQYAPGPKGLVEIEPFVSVPGHEGENIPKPESLPCSIIESWAKTSAVDPKGETGRQRK